MCLAIPAKILSIDNSYALADFDGLQKKVVVALIPDPKVGEYVIVHAGYAIEKIDEQAAQESLEEWHRLLERDDVRKEDFV